jgi:NAD/NADP transhydrogenase beta subunit
MIVVAGILYMTSAGDQGKVETAKKAVTAALIGLALALAAPALLKEIYTVLGAAGAPTAHRTLSQIIIETIKVLSGFVGSIAVLMLVVGGIMYITSAGDSTKADTAKNIIQYAIIGLVVALISLIVVTQVIGIF